MKMFAYLFAALVALVGAGVAQAQSSDTYVIHGTVERVDHAANRVFVRGDNGREYAVDISQGHATGSARNPGQEVTVYGRKTGEHRIEATHVVADRDYRSGSQADRDKWRPRGWEQLHGTVQDVEGSRMRLRTDDGRTVRVDLSALPDRREDMINNLRNGAVVTVTGDGDSRSDKFFARHVRFEDRDLNRRAWGGSGTPGTTTNRGETSISGRVETIHEDNLRLKTDDGRIVRIDIDPVREKVRERFKVGDRVTVIGTFTGDNNRMTARTVRVDSQSSSGSRGQSSSGPRAPSGEQQVRGTIETIHNDNMRLKVDGRVIRVDIDPVRDNVRERFKVGDRVTVVGTFSEDNRMVARTVRNVDDGSPAASPNTSRRPRNADDCKDRGWQNYSNPSFKNQGDCVSYANSRR